MPLAVTPLQVIVPEQPVAVIIAFSVPQSSVFVGVNTGAVGLSPTFITISTDFGLIPQIFSQTAVYVPAVLIVMTFVVSLVLHLIVPLQLLAVNFAVSFEQILVLSVTIVGVVGLTPVLIIKGLELSLLPQLFVQVAV